MLQIHVTFEMADEVKMLTTNFTRDIVLLSQMHHIDMFLHVYRIDHCTTFLAANFWSVLVVGLPVLLDQVSECASIPANVTCVPHSNMHFGFVALSRDIIRKLEITVPAFVAALFLHFFPEFSRLDLDHLPPLDHDTVVNMLSEFTDGNLQKEDRVRKS